MKYKHGVTNQETIKFWKIDVIKYEFFDKAKEVIKSRRLCWQILRVLHFSRFILKENHVFNEKDNPSQKGVIVEKETR